MFIKTTSFEEWLGVRAVLDNACRETNGALGRMVVWSNGWTRSDTELEESRNGGGGVTKLTELSFKKAIRGLVGQVFEIEHETSRLYRQGDFERWRGDTEYNISFDVTDARWVAVRWGIQKGLLAMQFYVDLWRSLFPDVYAEWGLYEEGMVELGRLVFVETQETEAAAVASVTVFRPDQADVKEQKGRMPEMVEIRGLLGRMQDLQARG